MLHPASTSLNLQAELRDPARDAASSALLPLSPDLVSGRLETGGSLRLSARFAPGTYDPSTTIVTFYLDTNPSTRLRGLNEAGDAAAILGVDYMIHAASPRRTQGQSWYYSKEAFFNGKQI